MKITSILTVLLIFLASIGAKAQSNDTLKVKTSAVCSECKEIIEKYMSFEKGVVSSDLNVQSHFLTVVYNPQKTNPERIRVAVTMSGYDADSLKADPKAFRKLPECCKRPHGE